MEPEIKIMPFRGTPTNMDFFVGKRVAITNFRKIISKKDPKDENKRGYYYDFQIVSKEKDESGKEGMFIFHAHDGSFEICEACDLWLRNNVQMPQYVTIGKEGNSRFFVEYHFTNKQVCDKIVADMNIQL